MQACLRISAPALLQVGWPARRAHMAATVAQEPSANSLHRAPGSAICHAKCADASSKELLGGRLQPHDVALFFMRLTLCQRPASMP